MNLAASIRVALAYRGKSQSWLANEMGVSKTYINRLAKGTSRPGMMQVEKIATALDYSISEFIALGE